MKRFDWKTVWLVAVVMLALAWQACAEVMPPPTTPWSRTFLKSSSSNTALTVLGVTPSGTTSVTNWWQTIPSGTDGSGLVNINSNSFDASTKAMLGGGSGGRTYTNPLTLYVATNGNDSTAVVGRQDLPWATLGLAISNAPANSLVSVGPGSFWISNAVWVPSAGVTIRATPSTTVYDTLVQSPIVCAIVPNDNLTVEGGVWDCSDTNNYGAMFGSGGTQSRAWTNVTLRGVSCRANTDFVYVNLSTSTLVYSLNIINSILRGRWDLVRFGISGPTVTVNIAGSIIESTGGSPQNPSGIGRPLRVDCKGFYYVSGSTISVSGENSCYGFSAGNYASTNFFSGVNILTYGTNTDSAFTQTATSSKFRGAFTWNGMAQFCSTNQPMAGDALRWDGTNFYWGN